MWRLVTFVFFYETPHKAKDLGISFSEQRRFICLYLLFGLAEFLLSESQKRTRNGVTIPHRNMVSRPYFVEPLCLVARSTDEDIYCKHNCKLLSRPKNTKETDTTLTDCLPAPVTIFSGHTPNQPSRIRSRGWLQNADRHGTFWITSELCASICVCRRYCFRRGVQ